MYRVLLRAFPREFRRQFGEDMTALFAERRRDARDAGVAAYAAFWSRTFVDMVQHGLAERRAMKRKRGDSPMRSFLQDIRFAFRLFRQRPGFTAAAVLTLALGIGINVAAFSIVDGVLIRWLAFPRPEEVVRVAEFAFDTPQGVSVPFYRMLQTTSTDVLSEVAAFKRTLVTLTGSGDAVAVPAAYVSPEFFDVVGVAPLMGRPLNAGDAAAGASSVAISSRFWRGKLGSDPLVLGRSIELDGKPATIVAVLARDAGVPSDVDLWRPLTFTPQELTSPNNRSLTTISRLRPGVDRATANAVIGQTAAAYYAGTPQAKDYSAVVLDFRADSIQFVRRDLLFVQGVAAIVLLIGCANLANLLLVSATSRQHELSIRAAIGADRRRLFRQLLAESLVLSVAGSIAGLMLAMWLVPLAISVYPGELPGAERIAISMREVAVAVGASLASTLLFGAAPAILASRADVASVLKSGPRTGSTRVAQFMRWTLVASEVALTLALLAGASLLIRSYAKLTLQPIGFDPTSVLTAQISLPSDRYPDEDSRRAAFDQLVQQVRRQPGVVNVATTMPLSFDGIGMAAVFKRVGEDAGPDRVVASFQKVSNEYLNVFRVPLLRGRFFNAGDTTGGQRVLVVNQQFAAKFAKGVDVLAMHLSDGDRIYDIVGVVADGRFNYLQKPRPFILMPASQQDTSSTKLAVLTSGNPDAFAPALRSVVRTFDAGIPVTPVSLADVVGKSVAVRRFNMSLLTALASLALMLSIVGIYGVTSYVVGQRQREMGIRLALGAAPGNVSRLMVRQGLIPILIGIAGGLAGAWYLTTFLKKELFEITPHDPGTLALAAAGFVCVGVLACWIPARRSARISPVEVLRAD